MKKQIIFIVLFTIIFLLIGCSSSIELNINFMVDGIIYDTIKTNKDTIKMPDDPKKDDYEFEGWFWDEDIWERPFTLSSIQNATIFDSLYIYAKFDTIVSEVNFYRLQEAYDLGFLKYEDLFEASFYHNSNWSGVPNGIVISRAAYPKTPEFLSAETERKIKQTFLDEFNLNNDNSVYYTIDDISISNYCGTYNNAVIVYLEGIYCYTEAEWNETISDIDFFYNNGNYLRVWIEQSIPYQIGITDNSMSSRENHNLLTVVRSKAELDAAASTRYYLYSTGSGEQFNDYYLAELTEKYDEKFFVENALVLCLFSASNVGGSIDIIGMKKQTKTLAICIDLHQGNANAISYWTLVIEVAQTDVLDITKVVMEKECNCPPPLVELIFVILTHEATVAAYNANKTYTPDDFLEYNFSYVKNLLTMEPNGPGFKRILFLYLSEPVDASDQDLQAAIKLIEQRPDVDSIS